MLIPTENKYSSKNDLTNETEIFKEKIRSTSQGSIKSYEVLSTQKKGSNYKVKVRFDISREEFKTYVKEEGTGSTKIKKGLFATIASENKESDSKIGFFKTPFNFFTTFFNICRNNLFLNLIKNGLPFNSKVLIIFY